MDQLFKFQGKPADYEFSELLLYEASIMVEAGKFKEALTHIYSHRDSILDIQSWLEMAGWNLFFNSFFLFFALTLSSDGA